MMKYRLGFLAAAAVANAMSAENPSCTTIQYDFPAGTNSNTSRADAVRDAYLRSWNEYEKDCFGVDDLLPISHACANDMAAFGLTIIEGMGTAIIMGLTDVVTKQLEHAATVDFT